MLSCSWMLPILLTKKHRTIENWYQIHGTIRLRSLSTLDTLCTTWGQQPSGLGQGVGLLVPNCLECSLSRHAQTLLLCVGTALILNMLKMEAAVCQLVTVVISSRVARLLLHGQFTRTTTYLLSSDTTMWPFWSGTWTLCKIRLTTEIIQSAHLRSHLTTEKWLFLKGSRLVISRHRFNITFSCQCFF